MTVRDVAGFLAVDEKTIYRLAQQGKLPGFKVAGTWRFQLQDIQGWIDVQKKFGKNGLTNANGGDK
jgi:excisionase family DNA binding protein